MIFLPMLRSRCFYLLLALLTYFIFSPFIIEAHVSHLILVILMAAIVIISIQIVAFNRFMVITSISLALLTGIAYAIITLTPNPSMNMYTIFFVINSSFLFCMTLFIIYTVAIQQEITIDTLLGAIAGYLLIGLTWSHFYLAMACFHPGAFTYHLSNGTLHDDIQRFIYFSYITLTTVGYGDMTPQTEIARSFSWLEAATGQIYLTVWISQLVAIHIAQRIRKNKI